MSDDPAATLCAPHPSCGLLTAPSLTSLTPPHDSFPDVDEIPSLYDVLGVAVEATADELKKAYRRLSLQFHPDKVASSSSSSSHADLAAATLRFQQIGFAYAVLKDDARREKYDRTGSTVEMSAEGAKTEAEWRDYFRELWTGEVSAQSIADFLKAYQGSSHSLSLSPPCCRAASQRADPSPSSRSQARTRSAATSSRRTSRPAATSTRSCRPSWARLSRTRTASSP